MRAQMDIDLEPERYKHHLLKEIPQRFHDLIDVRRFGPGERLVFLPYTREILIRRKAGCPPIGCSTLVLRSARPTRLPCVADVVWTCQAFLGTLFNHS